MSPVARVCVITFSSAIGAILLSAVLVTAANSQGSASSLRYPFRLLCHGRVERCLLLWNTPMPICSRCVGIYAGALASLGLFAATARRWNREMPSMTVVILTVPLVIDGLSQAIGLRESTNGLRLLTGLLAGLGGMAWVVSRLPRNRGENRDSLSADADFPP